MAILFMSMHAFALISDDILIKVEMIGTMVFIIGLYIFAKDYLVN